MTTTTYTRDRALARGGPFAWRAVDLVTAAILGVAFGVAFIGWDYLLNTPWSTLTAGFPPASSLALGVWLLPAVAGALVIRRPGAALFVEMVAALLEYLLGNPWGPGVLISGLLQGLGVEVAFALFRWRGWRLPHAVIAGALAAVFEIVLYEWWSYAAEYAWGWKLAVLAFSVISGVLVAGVGAHYLVRALARAGALRAFPPGAELAAAPEDPAYDAFPAAR
ncbi:MAG: ECF transporter S component [Austwickia sp.]|jgi:energy-coupling factor transport system substrate-specific component|nr:MAG: ECF transporter S component [Austwickia sp.]